MKILVTLVLFGFILHSHSEKIDFIDNDWQKATARAKQENKYLFVDCYTDWCYWCKVMVKKTFSKDEVAKAMNKNFVSLKMDMEHNYGKNLAMKYRVNSFPTYLIFNPEGQLVYRAVGNMEAKEFLAKLKDGRKPAKQQIAPGISEKVDMDFPDFYMQAFGTGSERKFPDSTTLGYYLGRQKDLFNEVNFDVLAYFAQTIPGKYKQYVIDNRAKYSALYTEDAVDGVIQSITQREDTSFNKLMARANGISNLFFAGKEKEETRAYYYQRHGDWPNFAAEVDTYLINCGYDKEVEINEWGRAVYERCNDDTIVARALGWMKPVIDMKLKYFSTDTYASLLYKAKKYNDAETYAHMAIELGKKEGKDTAETERLLGKIEKGKRLR